MFAGKAWDVFGERRFHIIGQIAGILPYLQLPQWPPSTGAGDSKHVQYEVNALMNNVAIESEPDITDRERNDASECKVRPRISVNPLKPAGEGDAGRAHNQCTGKKMPKGCAEVIENSLHL